MPFFILVSSNKKKAGPIIKLKMSPVNNAFKVNSNKSFFLVLNKNNERHGLMG